MDFSMSLDKNPEIIEKRPACPRGGGLSLGLLRIRRQERQGVRFKVPHNPDMLEKIKVVSDVEC
jgi:hypothetical protein